MKNIIIDYGVGNIDSLIKACEEIHFPVKVSSEAEEIKQANAIILPGVGAYEAAMNELEKLGLVDVIVEQAKIGTPILGICLGMQLLYEFSEENGGKKGLGLINGKIEKIPNQVKVPHMGWNKLYFNKEDGLTKYINDEEYVYFVHSYFVNSSNNELVAYCQYGIEIPAIIRSGNIIGMQFHPEKSSVVGLNLLKAFKELCIHDFISSN